MWVGPASTYHTPSRCRHTRRWPQREGTSRWRRRSRRAGRCTCHPAEQENRYVDMGMQRHMGQQVGQLDLERPSAWPWGYHQLRVTSTRADGFFLVSSNNTAFAPGHPEGSTLWGGWACEGFSRLCSLKARDHTENLRLEAGQPQPLSLMALTASPPLSLPGASPPSPYISLH